MKKLLFTVSILLSYIIALLIFSCGSSSISKDKNNYNIAKAKEDSLNIVLAAERRARNIIMEAEVRADIIIDKAKKSDSDIKKRELISKLEAKVKKIPVSKYKENLDIYKQLYELDPENKRYRDKIGFYEVRLKQEKKENTTKEQKKFIFKIEIITLDNRARLLSRIDGNMITRIPTGTQLGVLEQESVQYGGTLKWTVTWYKVNYNGKIGWISEHNCEKMN